VVHYPLPFHALDWKRARVPPDAIRRTNTKAGSTRGQRECVCVRRTRLYTVLVMVPSHTARVRKNVRVSGMAHPCESGATSRKLPLYRPARPLYDCSQLILAYSLLLPLTSSFTLFPSTRVYFLSIVSLVLQYGRHTPA